MTDRAVTTKEHRLAALIATYPPARTCALWANERHWVETGEADAAGKRPQLFLPSVAQAIADSEARGRAESAKQAQSRLTHEPDLIKELRALAAFPYDDTWNRFEITAAVARGLVQWLDNTSSDWALTRLDQYLAEVSELRSALAESAAPTVASAELSMQVGRDQPWPLRDCVEKLMEAADILLHQKDYDGAHWELIQSAWTHAKGYLNAPAVASAELEASVRWLRDVVEASEDAGCIADYKATTWHLDRIASALGVKS